MKLLEKIKQKKLDMEAKLQRARELNEEVKVEKYKKKRKKISSMEPGTIRHGLATRQSITDFFKDCKNRWDHKLGVKKNEK